MLMPRLLRLLSRLPLSVLYRVSDALAFLAMYVFRYRRSLVAENLSRSFPEKTPTQIHEITQGFYRNLADVVVETLKALTISKETLQTRVTFHGMDPINCYYQQGQSIILLAAHQCNWEWLLLAGCLRLPYPVDAVYKPLANQPMDALMQQTRARFGGQPISKDRVLRELLRRKNQRRAVAIVADQTPAWGTPKYWISFLRQETGFYRGIEQLPKAVQHPVFFVSMKRIKRGYYQAAFVQVGTPPYEKEELTILTNYAAQAEKVVQEQPANWLWSHKRWKYARSETEA